MASPGRSTGIGNRSLQLLQNDWSGGSRQDVPRDQIPPNAAWQLTDMVPGGGALAFSPYALKARFGWIRTCQAMSATTSSYAAAVGVAPYSGGTRILGVDEDGRLYKWTPAAGAPGVDSDGASTNVGAAVVPAHPPIFYRNYAYILDSAGSATGYRYDGTTLSNISGSPPTGSVGCVFKDHLVVAHSSANTNRVWFANAGDPTTWDTAASGQWLDCDGPVQGLVTFQNMILAFEEGKTERLRGDIIPGVVGSDFVREPLFNVGCSDPASIAIFDQFVVFANSNGIYMTDGLLPYDLTAQCGMSGYWRNALASYASAYTIAAGAYRDWYVFSVMNGSSLITAGAIQTKKKQYVVLQNVKATMMASTPNGVLDVPNRLLMSERAAARISDLGCIFDTSSYDNVDGDGTVIAPSISTRYYQGTDFTPKRWRSLYFTGNNGSPGSAATTVKYATTHMTDPSGGTTLSSSADMGSGGRKRLDLGKSNRGFSFHLAPAFSASVASAQGWHLEALEAEIDPQFGRRR